MEKLILETVMSNKKQSGFTLIELLVTIVIISILAAILFPVFARARENARRASCMSNLKQIGLGFMMYAQDYDEKFPPAMWEDPSTYSNPSTSASAHTFIEENPLNAATPAGKFIVSPGTGKGNYYSWMDFIFPYVKSVQIFTCPSFSNTSQADAPSYGYNVFISGLKGGSNGAKFPSVAPLALAAIQRPSEIILALDYPIYYGTYAHPSEYCSTADYLNPADTYYDKVWPHLDGGTVNFTDGHVKWYKRGSSSICRVDSSATAAAPNQRAWNPSLP
jgi:prepilin-type N-terminal cleavage/methylation domain-containing protein